MAKEKREHHSYRRGGRPKSDEPSKGPPMHQHQTKAGNPATRDKVAKASAKGMAVAQALAPGLQARRTRRRLATGEETDDAPNHGKEPV